MVSLVFEEGDLFGPTIGTPDFPQHAVGGTLIHIDAENYGGVTLLAWSVTDFWPQSTLLHSNCLNGKFGNTRSCASPPTTHRLHIHIHIQSHI
jgi:hypothetical protein